MAGVERGLSAGFRKPAVPWASILFSGFFLLFVAGGLVSGYLFYTSVRDIVAYYGLPSFAQFGVIEPRERAALSSRLADRDRVNILLLGVDRRPGESGPTRTDTMIVVTLDPESLTAGMLSIPRDLWVEVPGFGEHRINTAHFLGDRYSYPGGGAALAMRTVEYNLGVPIHYYARINFQGFRDIVDTLGGVTVEVPREIIDTQYPTDDYGYTTIRIPAGLQHMDGDVALRYVRTRHGSSDFDRVLRQQQVLLAMRERALRLDILPRLPDLIRTMGYTASTDMTPTDILALAQIGAEIDLDRIKAGAINQTMTERVILAENGADVLFPLRERICEVVEEIFAVRACSSPIEVLAREGS